MIDYQGFDKALDTNDGFDEENFDLDAYTEIRNCRDVSYRRAMGDLKVLDNTQYVGPFSSEKAATTWAKQVLGDRIRGDGCYVIPWFCHEMTSIGSYIHPRMALDKVNKLAESLREEAGSLSS